MGLFRRQPPASVRELEAVAAVGRIEEQLALIEAELSRAIRLIGATAETVLAIREHQTKRAKRAPRKPKPKAPVPAATHVVAPDGTRVDLEDPSAPSQEEESVLQEFERRFNELADGDEVPSIEVEEQLAAEFAGRLPQFPEQETREARRARAGRG